MRNRSTVQLGGLRSPVAGPVPVTPRLSVAPLPIDDPVQLGIGARGHDAVGFRESLRRRMLFAADTIALTAALLLVVGLHRVGRGALAGLAAALLVLTLFWLGGLYQRDELRLQHRTLDEVPVLLQLTGLCALCDVILASAVSAVSFRSGQVVTLWVAMSVTVLSGRVAARALARRVIPGERCLIIGEPRRADRIRARIIASRARTDVVDCLAATELAGDADALPAILEIVRERRIDRIIVAVGAAFGEDPVQLIRMVKGAGVRVSVVPEILDVVGWAVAFDELEGMVMLGLPPFGLRGSARHAKRLFDLAAASAGLILLVPLLAYIALAIRLDSAGPVLFRQTRIGRHGRPFRILKFRTMAVDAELRKDGLRALNVAGHGLFKLDDDPRATRVGRFLRRTSLDELPQLINVLRGDMTLVGPRPLVPDEDALVLGLDRSRLLLTPGLTGPWQLMGVRVPLEEMVAIDYLYASSWSLWLDLKLLVRTARHVVRAGNL